MNVSNEVSSVIDTLKLKLPNFLSQDDMNLKLCSNQLIVNEYNCLSVLFNGLYIFNYINMTREIRLNITIDLEFILK